MAEDLMSTDNVVRLRMLTQNSRLVDTRKAMGFTQVVMAKALAISASYLGHIETLRMVPSARLMEEIADLLDKPVDYLFPPVLLRAIREGLFDVRTAEISPPHLAYLTDRASPGLLSDGGQGAEGIEDEVDRALLHEKVDEVLHELTYRERTVIELRFGLKDGQARTLEEVGQDFNVTRERIREIEGKALRKLRHPVHSRKLKGYLR